MKCVRCKKHYSTVLVEHEDGTVEPVCELCYLNPYPKEIEMGDESRRESDLKELDKRFTYHAPKPGQPQRYEQIRTEGKILACYILDLCPDSRERSIAFTKLEEAVMWANAAIARNE